MHRSTHLSLVAASTVACTMLTPSTTDAQTRHTRARVVRPVVVGSFVYAPYCDPFFWGTYGWDPYFFPYEPWPSYGVYRGADGGAARLQVTPRETEVYVDGYLAGIVDDFDGFAQRLRVPAGEHEIELYLDGYRTIRETVLFRPGTTYRMSHTMERLPAGEPSEPRPRAAAEPRAPQSPPLPDDPSRSRPQSTPGRAAAGTLSIRVQPSGAAVLVDGERWEGADGHTRLAIELAEGTHRVEVRLEGFRPYSIEVRVRRGEVTTLNVGLSRQELEP